MLKNKLIESNWTQLCLNPLKSLDFINYSKSKVLAIGPRLEGEIFKMYENIHIKFIALKKSLIVVMADKHFDKKDYFSKKNEMEFD